MKTRKPFAKHRGFTLIEIMVTAVIIAILMSGVFMLMRVATNKGDIAKATAQVEMMRNAIETYNALYGHYPDVMAYPRSGTSISDGDIYQPVEFRFITWGPVPGVGESWEAGQGHKQLVTFGLLSFFYPRVKTLQLYPEDDLKTTYKTLIENGNHEQLREHIEPQKVSNLITMEELDPNISQLGRVLDELREHGMIEEHNDHGDNPSYLYITMRARDPWEHSLNYASEPPYQSYQIWSSGPDGKTCRDCWLGKHTKMCDSVKDDIGQFDK